MKQSVHHKIVKRDDILKWNDSGGPGYGRWSIYLCVSFGCGVNDKGGTHSIRSLANQWKDLINKRKPNIRANGTSNSSRKIVNASSDSVMKNQSRS